nr:PAAR domain-containing protein [Vibrio parahaemolyticus]
MTPNITPATEYRCPIRNKIRNPIHKKGVVMGKPAATITSMHICPKVTAKVPHVGGPVVVGSPNVKIGGLPAA